MRRKEVFIVLSDVFLFLLFVVAFGLLQAWVIMGLKMLYEPELYAEEIFDDGSLFFYATSLYGGAVYTLFIKEKLFGRRAFALLVFLFAILCVITGVFYGIDTKEMLESKQNMHSTIISKLSHLSLYLKIQLACAFVAVAVSLAIAVREASSSRKESRAEVEATPSNKELHPGEGGGETIPEMRQRRALSQ